VVSLFCLGSEEIYMDQDHKEYEEMLEQQLQRTKEQLTILDEMDNKLLAMKKIAEYAVRNNLNAKERSHLNEQLEQLKKEFDSLEALRHNNFH
jgi:hypothetical protein